MFICDDCLKKNYDNVGSFSLSRGQCEICKRVADCNDIPSAVLNPKHMIMTGVVTDHEGTPIEIPPADMRTIKFKAELEGTHFRHFFSMRVPAGEYQLRVTHYEESGSDTIKFKVETTESKEPDHNIQSINMGDTTAHVKDLPQMGDVEKGVHITGRKYFEMMGKLKQQSNFEEDFLNKPVPEFPKGIEKSAWKSWEENNQQLHNSGGVNPYAFVLGYKNGAKQVSIAFAEWMLVNHYESFVANNDNPMWLKQGMSARETSEQLFDKFILTYKPE